VRRWGGHEETEMEIGGERGSKEGRRCYRPGRMGSLGIRDGFGDLCLGGGMYVTYGYFAIMVIEPNDRMQREVAQNWIYYVREENYRYDGDGVRYQCTSREIVTSRQDNVNMLNNVTSNITMNTLE
jgi:hypothetical protein